MTKTYSEQRQLILFRAAREMRAVAAQALNDCTTMDTSANLAWAKDIAAKMANRANELESEGHEMCIASARSESTISKSHVAYSKAIDRHLTLVVRADQSTDRAAFRSRIEQARR